MEAEIITIGDELLIGQVVDTNSAWIAQQLINIGIQVKQITTISDEKQPILNALKDAAARAELVLVTGGLGPTKDDITKQAVCEFFNTKLILDNETLEHIRQLFSSRNLKMPEVNIKQAEIPEKCIPVKNNYGTAPGMWFEASLNPPEGGKIHPNGHRHGVMETPLPLRGAGSGLVFIFMPGVPYEMEAMMESEILPRLKQKFNTPFIVQKTILTQGIGESMLMEIIRDWEEDLYKKQVKLAYLPSFGSVRLRLTLSGNNKELIEEIINGKVSELKKIIPEYYSGEDGEKPEEVIGQLLRKKKQTLSTAESCTGGYIAHLITSIPGSSDYFTGSVVCYSNRIKTGELGVNDSDLQKYGTVSREVVESMAEGIRKKFGTDWAIATSGIAGPSGGTSEKPVGTVWIAVAGPEETVSKKYLFGKSREKNIRQSAAMALNMLRKEIIKKD